MNRIASTWPPRPPLPPEPPQYPPPPSPWRPEPRPPVVPAPSMQVVVAAEIIAGRWGGTGERLAGTEGPIHRTADR